MDAAEEKQLDPNTATEQELTDAGLSPERARAIVRFREEHGGIRGLDDLDNIPELDSVEPFTESNAMGLESPQRSDSGVAAEGEVTMGSVK